VKIYRAWFFRCLFYDNGSLLSNRFFSVQTNSFSIRLIVFL
jgi:hypothetical protein